MDTFFLAVALAWVVFWGYWLITALMTRSPVKRQQSSRWTRELIVIALVWGFCVFYSAEFSPGFLVQRTIPNDLAIGLTGTIITLMGLGFAVWARVHLGKYWSSMPAIRVDHKLIRTGPYSIVRHPIYTGISFAIAGTAIIIGEPLGLIAFLLILAAYLWKIRTEEKYLLEEFGEDYARYKKEVPALIPLLVWVYAAIQR
ncbi:MAG: isoprenylcysteine carboxylmethyltransferase family protein [Methanoregula sp.]|uniref:methyltransferase family protein n=1 Tax=Methanoregula sp. TaxID=2052170 RepID=UPI003C156E25